MKKIIAILFTLIMLAACSGTNSYSSLSDGDEVIFSGPGVTYTKNDLYKSLKVASTDAVVDDIVKNIAMTYDLDYDAIEAEAQSAIDGYIEGGYESYIIAYYGSVEAFKELYISDLLIGKLANIYVEDNFDSMTENDAPVKMQMASFKDIAEAEQCIEDMNNGTTFDTAALNNNSQSSPEAKIYTDTDSSLVYEVKEYLNSHDSLGVSDIITYTVTSTDADGQQQEDNTYYLLNVISRDVNEFKDEYVELAASSVEADTLYSYLFNKHDIQFYDQDLYELVTKEYEVLK
ncbi:MAG: membrane lipoprotein lipid attachment site-containing protein [Erysipelotrichaceae bacterium]|nr:membrane lipoprotein lipid attachment site-containing protein [Erysipelotrichaceae bacterium]